ncbi:MAG TPA: hypothetical protein VFF08_10700 [Trueperaceae bacterium]|nr:hypothetical protein [Trueperaceae bacterium]
MSVARYRRLTAGELEPFAGRDWVAWGASRDPRSFRLDGVSLHVPDHPEPVVFVWSFATVSGDERGTPVFSHVPYPHDLPKQARRTVEALQSYDGPFAGFLRLLDSLASRLD